MPFSLANNDLAIRVSTALRMVIESLADSFVSDVSEAELFRTVRNFVYSTQGDWPLSQLPITTALSALAPATILSSASRTAQTDSADQVNTVARGAVAVLNLTAFVTAASVTLCIQKKDSSGAYTTIAQAAAALTAVGKQVVVLDPVIGTEAGGFDKCVSGNLPHDWRIRVLHGNGNSQTYSVEVYPIR